MSRATATARGGYLMDHAPRDRVFHAGPSDLAVMAVLCRVSAGTMVEADWLRGEIKDTRVLPYIAATLRRLGEAGWTVTIRNGGAAEATEAGRRAYWSQVATEGAR